MWSHPAAHSVYVKIFCIHAPEKIVGISLDIWSQEHDALPKADAIDPYG